MEKRAAAKLVFLGNGDGDYDLEDLLRADAEVLGRGTFGTTYKAIFELEGIEKTLAVKRLRGDVLPEREFRKKIEELSKVFHENLLPIRAYYYSKDDRLLIYDYMNMGSFAFFLHGNGAATLPPLTWEERCSIADGVARGITYIHQQGTNICHGNLNSSNVLLTSSFEACLSDFCIYQLVPRKYQPNLMGYQAPEVTKSLEVSQKSDVYSFGVLLLELLTGKAPSCVLPEDLDLPKWVRSMSQEKQYIDVFDARLLKYERMEEQMVQLLQLAVCCTNENPNERPSMAAVTSQIEQIRIFKKPVETASAPFKTYFDDEMAWRAPDSTRVKMVFLGHDAGGYDFEDLLCSHANILGKGTFGMCYKARLEFDDKHTLAVKRLKADTLSEIEFKEKVEDLGKMVHENLLPITAYCCLQDERILVYEYMHIGSLAFLLHGNGDSTKTPLTWEERCNIAYGVARGIVYIHTRGSNVCHGNLRSSNVFLTTSFDVRISEYGLAQFVPLESKPNLNEVYLAQEVTNNHEVSQKSDVYSFGILLLELLTGKAPLGAVGNVEGIDLPKWIRLMFQENPIIDVFDVMLLKYENIGDQMVQLLQLAVCCTFENPGKRPSMAAVTNMIKNICRFKSQ